LLACDDPDLTRLFVIDYQGFGARYNVVDIDRAGGEPHLSVWSVEYAQMLLVDDYERLLRAAGFSHVSMYGSFEGEPYDRRTSASLIVVAR
jgi:hypothetical protein